MVLKRIELFGFKSFAEKTEIELNGNIVALLGPNGCGKSNVVDAVKWILGEQSSKSLRAEKMGDVIFAGTETKKALNVAEIALTLEASLPNFDASEIYLRRRIFRSGESEFFVNNVPVKLKELRKVLLDIGIGKSTYSVIEQGKVDQILSSKPEDRRYLFEEAADISRHRLKWQEAMRKLQRVNENTRQIENILSEVKRSYNNLKKQAEKTGKFRLLKDEQFELERNMYLLQMKKYQEEKDKKERAIENTTTAREDIRKQISQIDVYLEDNFAQVRRMDAELNEFNKRLYGHTIEKKSLQSQKSSLSERIQEVKERVEHEKNSVKTVQQRANDLKEEKDEAELQMADSVERLKTFGEGIQDLEEQIKSMQKIIYDNSNEEKSINEENRACEIRLDDFQGQLQTLTDDIVRELDEQLRTATPSIRKQAESRLDTTLTGHIQLLRRQRQRLSDLPSPMERGEELLNLFTESLSAFESIHNEIVAELKAYKKSIPVFIEEFLAPEGIITLKRKIDSTLLELRKTLDDNRQRITTLHKENKEWNSKVEKCQTAVSELLISAERERAEKKSFERDARNLLKRISELTAQIQSSHRKIAEDEGRLEGLMRQEDELARKRGDIQKQEGQIKNDMEDLRQKIAAERKKHAGKEGERAQLGKKLENAQSRHESSRESLVEVDTEIRNLRARFRDQHSRELSEFADLNVKETLPAIKQQLRALREHLHSLGAVNLMAVEEFNEVSERHDFLQKQLQDLNQAGKDLKQVTHQIREESSRRFMDSYERIQNNFNTLFRKLFGGGRAELQLLDPDDPLESGIGIYVRPPGKKTENISMLSGGERSLTAIALLFSAYMLRPSPFCFLDEIDAALDESNIGRFIALLADFAKSTQFVIITHNKRTVAAADTLLGVTMEESGISKAIAVRLTGDQTNGQPEAEAETDGEPEGQPGGE